MRQDHTEQGYSVTASECRQLPDAKDHDRIKSTLHLSCDSFLAA